MDKGPVEQSEELRYVRETYHMTDLGDVQLSIRKSTIRSDAYLTPDATWLACWVPPPRFPVQRAFKHTRS